VLAVAGFLGVDAFALAVGDSVDFRLLFSSADSQAHRLIGEFHAREWEIHEIGSLVEPIGEPRVLCRKDGNTFEMPGIEWTQSDELTIDSLRGAS